MSEERVVRRSERRGARGITGALILIALGAAFLLNNLGIISVDWFSLWRYWPVLLVVVGLDLLLSRSVLGSLVAAVIGLVLIGGVLFLASSDADPVQTRLGNITTTSVDTDLDGAEELSVQIDLGAGEASIGTGTSAGLALEGSYTTRENLELALSSTRRGSSLDVLLEQSGEAVNVVGFQSGLLGELELDLTDEVPVSLVVNTGASSMEMDLRELDLTTLEIEGGVGALELTLPEAGEYDVNVDGGIGSFDITIPPGVEARLEVDSGLTSTDIPSRFDKIEDGVWETDGYGSAEAQALIRVSAGIGSINFR